MGELEPNGPVGSHALLVCQDLGEAHSAGREFAREGIDAGERVIWVNGGPSFEELFAALRSGGLNVGDLMAEARLEFHSLRSWFSPEGFVDRSHALSLVRAEVARAKEEGFFGVRFVHQMGGIGRRDGDLPALTAYEAGLNLLLDEEPVCSVLCVFNLDRASPELLLRGFLSHPDEADLTGRTRANPQFDRWLQVGESVPDKEVEERVQLLRELREELRLRRAVGPVPRIFKALRNASEEAFSGKELLTRFLGDLCLELGVPAGHLWTPTAEGDALVSSGIIHSDEPHVRDALAEVVRGARFRKGEGLPGRAWEAGSPVRGADTTVEVPVAEHQHGEGAVFGRAWALPVVSRGHCHGVFELSFGREQELDEYVDEALEPVGWVAGELFARAEAQEADERGAGRTGVGAEEELQLLQSALRSVGEAVVITTASFRGGGPSILYANPAFLEMTGYTELEVLGRSFRLLSGPETEPESVERVRESLKRGTAASEEVVAYRKDGSQFLMRWDVFPMRNSEGQVRTFISILRDVTETRRVEEALRKAERDSLTGIANRHVFLKRLSRLIERSERRNDFRFAVLFLDLDGFKEVNDQLGHLIGDELLSAVARRLEDSVRPGDTVSRFGGDEFVILLEHVEHIGDVLLVADRIESQLSRSFDLRGEEVSVGASIGIVLSDSDYPDADAMLGDADAAMYRAKREGGRRYRLADDELMAEMLALSQLRDDLRAALESEQFILHFQPVVELATGGIAGFEALLRWNHPDRGLLLPGDFISLAGEMNLLVPIGRWVLREACRQLRAWQDRYRPDAPPILSVNLSASELTAPMWIRGLEEAVEETGVDPHFLQLEIPEEVLAQGPPGISEVLEALGSMGVGVSIDNFGRGYSTLASLPRFPVDLLKLDPLFVGNLRETGFESGSVVRSVLALARSLGMQVIAEGVETPAQRETLHRLACPYAQGFLFSRPVDLLGAEDLLRMSSSGSWGTGNGNGSVSQEAPPGE